MPQTERHDHIIQDARVKAFQQELNAKNKLIDELTHTNNDFKFKFTSLNEKKMIIVLFISRSFISYKQIGINAKSN